MRIATITNWAYGATVALTLVSGATMYFASQAEDRERATVAQRETFDQLTDRTEEDSFRLSDEARLYAINGNPVHLVIYRRELAELGPVERRLAGLHDAGAGPEELSALRQALHEVDLLRDEQAAAIAAVGQGHPETARQILFSADYERDLDRAREAIDRFKVSLNQRSDLSVTEAAQATRLLRTTSEVLIGMTALLFLFVLFFVLTRRILRPVVKLSDVVTRLAAQDFDVEPPRLTQIDEIGDMAGAIAVFRENGLERQRLEAARDSDQARRDLLARMMQRLHGCDRIGDLGQVVGLFAGEIAPDFAGRLYVHDDARRLMVEASSWQEPRHSPSEFPPTDCWALRRGQLHRPSGARIDIGCPHAGAGTDDDICIPLIAQGETIGLLYLEKKSPALTPPADLENYLALMAENIALALANLRLQAALREMALNDPLTGLFNRRQLDTLLGIQLTQAAQSGQPLSCLMLDVDHFKRFNDDYGHEAGDAVLRGVGDILSHSVRGDGVAFRYGGEEFLLLMPGFGLDAAQARAEQIRERVGRLAVTHEGRSVGPITCSIGIVAFPEHGSDALVQTADAALLRAKEAGRNRTLVATVRGKTIAA